MSLQRMAYQEERVGHEGVKENSPASPTASAFSPIERLGAGYGDNDANKLVARIRNKIKQLALARYAQKVTSQLEGNDLNNNYNHARGGGVP